MRMPQLRIELMTSASENMALTKIQVPKTADWIYVVCAVYCPGNQTAEDKTDGACVTYAREEIYITRFGGESLKRQY
jgi:hypothetical protein